MQWISFIEGDRLVVYELLTDVLFSSAICLVLQTSQHTLPRVEHFVKHSMFMGCVPFSNSRILSANFCVRNVRTILNQCGANRILSVNFCVRGVRTILQQCVANCILSVNLCLRRTYHLATVWGNRTLSVYFCERDVRMRFSNSMA